jgi:hypothetical protein
MPLGVDTLNVQAGVVLTELLGALLDQDPATTIAPYISPGIAPNYGDCCDGQAFVKFASTYASTKAQPARNCPWLDVTWEVTIIRCVNYNDDGTVDQTELDRASGAQLKDYSSMLCRLSRLGDVSVTPTFAEGGCLSATVQVTILTSTC